MTKPDTKPANWPAAWGRPVRLWQRSGTGLKVVLGVAAFGIILATAYVIGFVVRLTTDLTFDAGGFVGAIIGVIGVFAVNHLEIRQALGHEARSQTAAAALAESIVRLRYITFAATARGLGARILKIALAPNPNQPQIDVALARAIKKTAEGALERIRGSEIALLDFALRLSPACGVELMERGAIFDRLSRTTIELLAAYTYGMESHTLDQVGLYLEMVTDVIEPLSQKLTASPASEAYLAIRQEAARSKKLADILRLRDRSDPDTQLVLAEVDD